MSLHRILLASAATMAITVGSADAALIAGGFSMTGLEDFTYTQANGTVESLSFDTGTAGDDGTFLAEDGVGDFAGIDGTIGDVFGGSIDAMGLIWSIDWDGTNYTFTGDRVHRNQVTGGPDGPQDLALWIGGTLAGGEFDDTPGIWIFTGNEIDGEFGVTSSWSASTGAVPEPASAAALGIGLLGLFGARRLTRKD